MYSRKSYRRAANATPELRGASLAEQLNHSAHTLGGKIDKSQPLISGQVHVPAPGSTPRLESGVSALNLRQT
jgi:hypothetical protein